MQTALRDFATTSQEAIAAALPQAVLDNSTAVAWTVGAILLYTIYRTVLFNDKRKPPADHWTKDNEQFDKMRQKLYPPAFPNGWYKLCDESDLDEGRIQSVSALGLNLIVFKTPATGKICVMDAFCPHLGAHLGVGGKVTDKGVVCPFHGWCISDEGKVTDIPYCTGSLPAGQVSRTYRHRIWLGCVMFWFHCENFSEEAKRANGGLGEELVPPDYELADPTADAGVKKWQRYVVQKSTYRQHLSEMSSNSPDHPHFNVVHDTLNFPWWLSWLTDRIFQIHHGLELYDKADEVGKQHLFFSNTANVSVFGIPLPYSQLTVVDMEGPSILHFHIDTPIGSIHLVKTLLPLSAFRQHVEDAWFRDNKMPLWIAHLLAYIARGALEQDRSIWENKTYLQKPLLVKGDGPFSKFRTWYKQFYSEYSQDYCESSDNDQRRRFEW